MSQETVLPPEMAWGFDSLHGQRRICDGEFAAPLDGSHSGLVERFAKPPGVTAPQVRILHRPLRDVA